MISTKVKSSTKLLVIITFIIMVTINGLANVLPINGMDTGKISDSYPNLFAPAGITFAIWGVIYLLLAIYTIYQTGVFRFKDNEASGELLNKVGIIFSLSSIANAAWIFSWHYQVIPLSMGLMIAILISLILINRTIDREQLSKKEQFYIRLPFSIYFGWITVATIANATVLLVSLDWNRLGLPESMWTIIILIVGMVIGNITMIKYKDIAYGIVLIWAYFGIWIKHTSLAGYSGQYPSIIMTILMCIGLFIISEAYIIITIRKTLKTG